MSRTFLTADWRKLIMAQYAVDPAILAPFVPAGTEIDLYQGECFVSIVGFLFDNVRVKGIRVPFHVRFEEINLRFYVLRREPYGPYKRGVVFIREFVPRTAISLVARKVYEEPYAVLPTSHSIKRVGNSLDVRYSWNFRRKWQTLAVEASPVPQPIAPGSEEAFLTERYWGYTRRSEGGTSEYEVQHPAWQSYPITRHRIYGDFGAAFGPAFVGLNRREPSSVLLADGSPVSVMSGTRLKH
jgi:uncharacterized protein